MEVITNMTKEDWKKYGGLKLDEIEEEYFTLRNIVISCVSELYSCRPEFGTPENMFSELKVNEVKLLQRD